jgi:hypothetical protein
VIVEVVVVAKKSAALGVITGVKFINTLARGKLKARGFRRGHTLVVAKVPGVVAKAVAGPRAPRRRPVSGHFKASLASFCQAVDLGVAATPQAAAVAAGTAGVADVGALAGVAVVELRDDCTGLAPAAEVPSPIRIVEGRGVRATLDVGEPTLLVHDDVIGEGVDVVELAVQRALVHVGDARLFM